MKKLLVVGTLAVGILGAAGLVESASAQTSVGLSIGINQPGVYGQINIGALPAPALVAPQPVIVAPGAVGVPPAYLYVPAAEQRDWRRYCNKYNACGRPVYFVREDWLRARYAQEHPGWDRRAAVAAHERREHERHD